MDYRSYTILNMLILAIVLVSCIPQEVIEQGIVIARVNDNVLTLEEIKDSYGENLWNAMTRDEQREVISQWVNLTALCESAKSDDIIRNDHAIKFRAKNAEKKIFANAKIAKSIDTMTFTEEELYDYYRLHQANFIEQVREYQVQRIFFRNEDEMKRVKRMLDNKEITFTPAAQQYSQESIGRNGGYMNYRVTKAGADSLLWRALSKLDIYYEITLPYQSGWIIARYYGSQEATSNSSFYDVIDQIEARLKEDKKSDVYDTILKEAREASNIVIEY